MLMEGFEARDSGFVIRDLGIVIRDSGFVIWTIINEFGIKEITDSEKEETCFGIGDPPTADKFGIWTGINES